MNEETEKIVQYIKQYSGTYTRVSIDSQLQSAGYSPEEIDAGWEWVKEEEGPARSQTLPSGQVPPRQKGGLLAFVVFLVIVGIILVLLTNLALALSYFSGNSVLKDTIIAVVNIGSLAVIIGLAIATRQFVKRDWSIGKIAAVVFAAALNWYTVVLGTCLYAPNALG